ncbi:hypothetical protein PO909_003836 [Leuciscus waleckii]
MTSYTCTTRDTALRQSFSHSGAFALSTFFSLEASTTQLTQVNTRARRVFVLFVSGPAADDTMPSSGISGRNQSFTDQSAFISRMLACYGQQQLNL